MTRVAKLSFVALVVATVAITGCKKQDDTKKNRTKNRTSKVQTKTNTPPVTNTKPVTGENLIKAITDCWAAFDAEDAKKFAACYDANAKLELVDQVAMMPNQPLKAANVAGIMKVVGGYWAMFKLEHHLDLVLVSGQNAVVIARADTVQDGAMPGMKASNKVVKSFAAQLSTFDAKGKLTSDLHFYDHTTMAGQMGKLPAGTPFRPAWTKALWEAPIRVVAKNDAKEAKNLTAYKAWLADISSGDKKKALAHMADGAVMHHMDAPKDSNGKKEIGAFLDMFARGFPKFKLTSTKAWAAGDWTVSYTVFTGKNTGPIPGLTPKGTGKDVTSRSLNITRWENGKVKEHFVFANGFHFFASLFPERVEAMKNKMTKEMDGAHEHAPAGKIGQSEKTGPAGVIKPPAKDKAPTKTAPTKTAPTKTAPTKTAPIK